MRWLCVGKCQALLLFYARPKRLTPSFLSFKTPLFCKVSNMLPSIGNEKLFYFSSDLRNTNFQILKEFCLMLFSLQ